MELDENLTTGRHPAVVTVAGYFDARRIEPAFRGLAAELEHTARTMLSVIPDSPELTVGLRKLLEARDCFIRAAQEAGEDGTLRGPLPEA